MKAIHFEKVLSNHDAKNSGAQTEELPQTHHDRKNDTSREFRQSGQTYTEHKEQEKRKAREGSLPKHVNPSAGVYYLPQC